MIKDLPCCVRLPIETLAQVDALISIERESLPPSARLTRNSMIKTLLLLGVKARREQLAEQQREQAAHDEKRAARLERDA